MSAVIKLSSPATHEFWQIPVLFEDNDLLALDKPSNLPTSPNGEDPQRPSLMKLLHDGIQNAKPWATERALTYLMNAHRLDSETSGVILLTKGKPVFVQLADLFGAEKVSRKHLALVHGAPADESLEIEARLAPHPTRPELVRVDIKEGKHARTRVQVLERFASFTLLRCEPLTLRAHQIQVHLRHAGLPLVGDAVYGGRPLFLSNLKRNYRAKEGEQEKPLMGRAALHAESLQLTHPVTGGTLEISAPWPKDLKVALKYLRQFGR